MDVIVFNILNTLIHLKCGSGFWKGSSSEVYLITSLETSVF